MKKLLTLSVVCLVITSAIWPSSLTFEERVKAQEAIERVYYKNRIWPKENPGPKPPFEKMVPAEVVRTKAEDVVLKSFALQEIWGRPITPVQLQAEMDRFAKKTKDPDGLKALYAALGNDPEVIAEVLARQTLSDRLIRTWYAWDPRFHGEKKRLAEDIVAKPEMFFSAPPNGVEISSRRFDLISGVAVDNKEEVSSITGREDAPSFKVPVEILESLQKEAIAEPVLLVTEEEDFFIASRYERENFSEGVAWAVRVDKVPFVTWWKEQRNKQNLREGLDHISDEIGINFTLRSPESAEPASPDSWKPLDAPPSCRSRHTAIWTGNQMIVWGGYNDNYLNSGGIYTPITDTWETVAVTSSSPSFRAYHTAIWTGEEMVIWGGFNGSSYLNDGACYSPATNSWRQIPSNPSISARGRHTAVWTGSHMIIWGGDSGTYYGDGWKLNPLNLTWTSISTTDSPSARTRHTAVWTGTQMVIWGGYNGAYLATGSRYSPKSDTWSLVSASGAPPVGRADHTAVWAGSRMLVWGGYSGALEQTGAQYVESSDTWVTISTTNAPSARRNHTAVWTGSKMIVWGGGEHSTSTSGLNSGGVFDIELNAWVATASSSAPDVRRLHSAVWTGEEMIVWGGTQSYEKWSMNSGGRYSLSDGSWAPTSTGSGQPHYRAEATAVWSGSDMIVWGGNYYYRDNGPIDLNTGGRYNPITDSWVPTSTGLGVPGIRLLHTALWTGTEMMIWGGLHYYSTYYNDGAKYDPGTDEWTPIDSTSLSGRSEHSEAWTGTDLIVWGGYNGSYLNSGAIYNKLSDSWKILPTYNAPSSRSLAGASWANGEMIIWGGITSGNTILNTGGRYNPTTETWTSTSTEGSCPTGRFRNGHVWTGNEVVIWAGCQSGIVPVNTGASYYPTSNTWGTVPLSADTPCERSNFKFGLWTGYEAFFWGGYKRVANSNQGDGGRYNPAIKTWKYVPVTYQSPEPRYEHVAVWTGKAAIIWGGFPYTNGGGLFYPNTPPRALGDILNSFGGQGDTLGLGTTDSLQLDGASSTSGSNPGSIPAYSDALDSIVEYAWDLNGDVVLDASGGLVSGSFDRFTATVTIAQEDLYLFGLDQPGDKTITFRVTDELGVKSWQTMTLHLRDVVPPALSVVSPNGGETWPYSVSESVRSQRLLVWTVADDLGLTRLKLSYTTKTSPSEGDWVCIADTKTPGGDCGPSGLELTSNSFLWDLPTLGEAAATGQTFPSATALIRVQAWDASDNLTTDISDSSFYIVQPTSTAQETLILWNSERIGSASSVSEKLADLAASPKVNGVVLDLKNAATLTPLYSAWDADNPVTDANPGLANAVADGIRAYIKNQVEGTYTNAKYLVLVGDDHAIPFYRVDDGTATFPEGSQYSSAVDCATPVGRAYCTNHYLTDNIYGDLDYETTGSVGVGFLALPDLATGRLIETPEEIMATVDTFISQDGQIDLNKVLVAGYDFLSDSATHAKKAYQDGGETVFDRIGGNWGPTELESDIFPALPANRYAMHHLNVHTDHHSLGTPTEVLEAVSMDAHSGRPLEGSLFYNIGCHSGLNAPDIWASGKYPLDLPQLMLRKGAAAYVGNTGFGWGLKHGVGYSERLMELVADRVLANASSSLGDCLAQAKRDYYLENHRYDVFDEKALFESTLYGLPMYELVVDPVSLRAEVDLLKMDGPDNQESAGIIMEKSPAHNREETLPDGVTETVVNFWFGPSTYALNPTGDGSYYALNGKSSGEVGDVFAP